MNAEPFRFAMTARLLFSGAPLNFWRDNGRDTRVRTSVLAVLFLVAPLFALLTWSLGPGTNTMRHLSLPVVAGEIALVMLACMDGFRPLAAWRRLFSLTRVASGIWMALALFSALMAQSTPAVALFLFVSTFFHALLGLAVYDRSKAGWLGWQDRLYLAIAFGIMAYGVVAAIAVMTARVAPSFDWTYFGVGVSHVRQIAFYGLTLLGVAAGLIASGSRIVPRLLLAALLITGWFLVGWSGGRAAFGAGVAASALLLVLARAQRLRAVCLFTTGGLAGMLLSQAAAPAPQWGAETIFERAAQVGQSSYSSGRSAVWRETWRRIQERPAIGHGQGQFIHEVRVIAMPINHPHNAPLQFAYQWGFVGTIALLLMLFSSALIVSRAELDRLRPAFPSIGTFAGLVSMSLLEGSLYHAFPTMIVVICLALTVATASAGAACSSDSLGEA